MKKKICMHARTHSRTHTWHALHEHGAFFHQTFISAPIIAMLFHVETTKLSIERANWSPHEQNQKARKIFSICTQKTFHDLIYVDSMKIIASKMMISIGEMKCAHRLERAQFHAFCCYFFLAFLGHFLRLLTDQWNYAWLPHFK